MTLIVFLKITQMSISTLIPTFPKKPQMLGGSVHSVIISSISQAQVRSEKAEGRTGWDSTSGQQDRRWPVGESLATAHFAGTVARPKAPGA